MSPETTRKNMLLSGTLQFGRIPTITWGGGGGIGMGDTMQS